jgi:hypothetical protein
MSLVPSSFDSLETPSKAASVTVVLASTSQSDLTGGQTDLGIAAQMGLPAISTKPTELSSRESEASPISETPSKLFSMLGVLTASQSPEPETALIPVVQDSISQKAESVDEFFANSDLLSETLSIRYSKV